MKKISILGSTGSVGSQCLQVLNDCCKDYISVDALSCHSNYMLLAEQAIAFNAKRVLISNEFYLPLKERLSGTNIVVENDINERGLFMDNDLLMIGISGIDALIPMYNALLDGVVVATSNKESIVCGGRLLSQYMDKIYPLDSEHYAIADLLSGSNKNEIESISLTATGGPFFMKDKSNVAVSDALKHPIWNMGSKNSIDSATMMNKVLEVIEAHYLFGIEKENIRILIHPEAIVHGIVEFVDGAQHVFMSSPDMKLGIKGTLGNFLPLKGNFQYGKVSLAGKNLTFYDADCIEFPMLQFLDTNQEIALTAANEMVVEEFLNGRISFIEMPRVLECYLKQSFYSPNDLKNIQDVVDVYSQVRMRVKSMMCA